MPDGSWHRIISLGCLCWPCQATALLRAHSWGSGDTLPALRHPKLIHLSLLRVVKRFMVLGVVIQPRTGGEGVETIPQYKWLLKDVLLWKHQTKLGKKHLEQLFSTGGGRGGWCKAVRFQYKGLNLLRNPHKCSWADVSSGSSLLHLYLNLGFGSEDFLLLPQFPTSTSEAHVWPMSSLEMQIHSEYKEFLPTEIWIPAQKSWQGKGFWRVKKENEGFCCWYGENWKSFHLVWFKMLF